MYPVNGPSSLEIPSAAMEIPASDPLRAFQKFWKTLKETAKQYFLTTQLDK
jgi:hypothetical protein